MLRAVKILLLLSGVFTQNENWAVFYPPSKVCAVRGFDAVLPCSYSYPQKHLVIQMLWCSMKTKKDNCMNPPHVYDSNSPVSSDYVYTGDDKSICTLLIHNVQYHHSAEYRFRFITNVTTGKFTSKEQVTLEVADLKVSLIRISGNGTITEGDSLNLTCDLNCTHAPSEFIWSKNNQNINQSGPVLHFPNVTVEDSGNYICTWRRYESWGSYSIFLHVEESADQNPDCLPVSINVVVLVVVVLVVGGILIGLVVAAVICSRRRKAKAPEETSGGNGEASQTRGKICKSQLNPVHQPNRGILPEEEVAYASVCIKLNKATKKNAEEQKDDTAVLYSTVKTC